MITPNKGQVIYALVAMLLLIRDDMCHNVNTLKEIFSFDLCGDEISHHFAGFSEICSSINGCGQNKPVLSKGGHTNVVTYSYTYRIMVFFVTTIIIPW